MLFVAGIGIAVFLQLLLVSKKNKSAADKVLAVWLFVMAVHQFFFYIHYTDYVLNLPFLLGIEHPLPLLHGILLFLYVSVIIDRLPKRRALLWLHAVPVIALYAYLIPFFTLSGEAKIEIYRNHGVGYETFMAVKVYATALSGLVYVVWSELLLRWHTLRIREQFSNLEKVDLRWLRMLIFGLGGIWLLVIVFHNDAVVFTGVSFFVFIIGFFGIRQSVIFAATVPLDSRVFEPVTDAAAEDPALPATDGSAEQRKKYPKSGLTEEASAKLHGELVLAMEREALYKKSDLSINDLATHLHVHPNYLSQAINQIDKKNFYDFVNTYRIEEFKRQIALPDNRQFTLLSIAFDCGFNSKSSFNRCFKKATGKTPSEYVEGLASESGTRPAFPSE